MKSFAYGSISNFLKGQTELLLITEILKVVLLTRKFSAKKSLFFPALNFMEILCVK